MKKLNTGLLTVLSTMSFLVSSEAVQNSSSCDDSNSVNHNENISNYREIYLLEKNIDELTKQLNDVTKQLNERRQEKIVQKMLQMLKANKDIDKNFDSLIKDEADYSLYDYGSPTGRYMAFLPSNFNIYQKMDRKEYSSYLEQLINQRQEILKAITD